MVVMPYGHTGGLGGLLNTCSLCAVGSSAQQYVAVICLLIIVSFRTVVLTIGFYNDIFDVSFEIKFKIKNIWLETQESFRLSVLSL